MNIGNNGNDNSENGRRKDSEGEESNERKPEFSSMAIHTSRSLTLPSNLTLPKPAFGKPTLTADSKLRFRKLDTQEPSNAQTRPGKPSDKWYVREAPPLPLFPLERSVEINQSSDVIAQRIASCLRDRSVFAAFDCQKGVASCVTGEYTRFTISLFTPDNNCKESTIVEILFNTGHQNLYREERRAILNAAEGVEVTCAKAKQFVIPDSILCQYKPDSDEELTAIFERSVITYNTGKRDEQLMTLRNLSGMVCPKTAIQDSSVRLARTFMTSNIGIRDIVANLLTGPIIDQMNARIRNAAVTILINAMTVLVESEGSRTNFEEIINHDMTWFTQSLLPALLNDIKNCDCIHNACKSTTCLYILLSNSQAFLQFVRSQCNVMKVLEEAVVRGAGYHKKLHDEALSTINALKCQ